MRSLPCAAAARPDDLRSASDLRPLRRALALCIALGVLGACSNHEPDVASERAASDAATSSVEGAPPQRPDADEAGAAAAPARPPRMPTTASPGLDLDAGDEDGGATQAGSCDVKAPTACSDPPLRYAAVEPIFMQHCAVCHNGMDGRWPLTSYQHVADWYAEIRGQLLACTMPPRDSGVTITREERERILLWIRCGFPR